MAAMGDDRITSALESMSLRRRVAQMVMVGSDERFDGKLQRGLASMVRDEGVGGVIVAARNAADPVSVRAFRDALQEAAAEAAADADAAGAGLPLLIMADQEGGIVMQVVEGATVFPGSMALAATGDPQSAYIASRIMGIEAAAMGINVVCGPVVDVNADPDNPIIGIRSFGDSTRGVGAFGAAAVRGFADGGVLCVAKHFPGHGRTSVDSHLDLPALESPAEEVRAVDLPPFAQAVAAGVPAVMTAHIRVPSIDETGACATVSRRLLSGILRHQMGFEGLIITDCLEMGAIRNTVGTAGAAVLAVEAGADIVLACHTYEVQLKMIDALMKAVEAGRISEERINASCGRILAAKARLARACPDLAVVGCAEHLAVERELALKSITLVRNDGVLPLGIEGVRRAAVVCPSIMPKLRSEDLVEGVSAMVLAQEVARRGVEVLEAEVGLEPTEAQIAAAVHAVTQADAAIVATSSRTVQHERAQGRMVRALLEAAGDKPLVACAIRNPYDIREYPSVKAYLVTYGYRTCSVKALVDVVFGARAPRGKLPVELPGLYPRGHGLTY